MGVSQENNGYYECIARDGYHLLEGGDASYFYIIASQTARLKVIGKFAINFVPQPGGCDEEIFLSHLFFLDLKVSGGPLL